jgi:NAD(P) transhydrogenase subunit alpha
MEKLLIKIKERKMENNQLNSLVNVLKTIENNEINQQMNTSDPFVLSLTIFILACFVGYYVVWKVTPALHTPLMSVTNAISGIIIVGAIIAVGSSTNLFTSTLGFFAVMIAAINIFGGFIVTIRMLEMFRKK